MSKNKNYKHIFCPISNTKVCEHPECRHDRKPQPIENFNSDKGCPGGKKAICKECKSLQQKCYRYGFKNFKEILNFVAASNSSCNICEKQLDIYSADRKNYVCMDHCHSIHVIRGILCDDCNVALGRFKDNPEFLKTAAHYLEEFNQYSSSNAPIP